MHLQLRPSRYFIISQEVMPLPAYKDAKKGTWYVKFRYTDWQGNRKETTKRGFATKREAKEYEQEFIRKAEGTADSDKLITKTLDAL